MLEISEFTLFKGKEQLVSSTSFSVQSGEVFVIMGKSGTGKSTFLSWLIGSLTDDFKATGDIYIDGKAIDSLPIQKRQIGILFQDDLLFPHLSVAGNLLFALTPEIKGKKNRQNEVEKLLEQVGLSGFGHRDITTLSGGQRARVSLLRALAAKPKALLLDEPFSSLDPELREQFRQYVYQAVFAAKIPTILVTHDQNDIPEKSTVIHF